MKDKVFSSDQSGQSAGAVGKPKPGDWRVTKDPHGPTHQVERYSFFRAGPWSPIYRWTPKHTAASKAAAVNWIEREMKRPIIVAYVSPKP